MRALTILLGALALVLGAVLGWRLVRGGEDAAGVPPAAQVRGAPLRLPPGTQPGEGGAAPGAGGAAGGGSERSMPATGAPELGADYAGLLAPEEAAKYTWVEFRTLTAFQFPGFVTTGGGVELPELPREVLELEGRLVALEGFMNPMRFDADGVSEFTLVADPQFCCFGVTPQLNHFVHVTMGAGERSEFYSIVPLAVYGRFELGPEESDGLIVSLYRLRAEHVFSVY